MSEWERQPEKCTDHAIGYDAWSNNINVFSDVTM